jgi:ADP-ribose pyrophosphatase YjhB (NUDIX family)
MGLRIRVGAICRRNETILLVEHQKEQKRYWLPPGGGIQKGEFARDAVAREVFEETSIRVEPKRLVCICESIFPDNNRHIVHFLYETTYLSGEPAASKDHRVVRSTFMPIDALHQLELRPPLQQWLGERLTSGFSDKVEYLGALWV